MIDDLIKTRRQQEALQKKNDTVGGSTAAGSNNGKNKRINLKAQSTAKQQQKPTNVDKSIGSNKAKRNAKISSKRGVSDTSKATPMQVEREVYRQSRTGGPKKNGSDSVPTRRSRRIRGGNQNNLTNSNKSLADQKMKQKNIARQKKQGQQQQQQQQKEKLNKNQGNDEVLKPPKKVIGVAKKAMQEAGFVPPKGMKMVVSFVAPEKNQNGTGAKKQNGNNTGRKKSAIRQNQNEEKEQSNNANGGGSRRGRWLRRNGNLMEE